MADRRAAKQVLQRCISCFKGHPTSMQPQMDNLPRARVSPARAFANCGVVYTGPFFVINNRIAKIFQKAYVCLFVGFATKAIHIELAVELTPKSFLNCLRRFISRRGRIYAIHWTTETIGQLKELGLLLTSREHNHKISEMLLKEEVEWHLIPPRAPHFGGL